MPSKTKKNSRTPSRLSNSDQSASSPRTPSLASSIDLEACQQEDIALCLEEASSKYPSLIGTSAFIGRITDVEAESSTTTRGCKIWLSESSMVSSSFAPGSIVSVSLAAVERRFSGSSCPLISFIHEWTRQCEVESVDEINNVAGNYFALATVFPSCKVSKNGVRLSSNLAYTMGCPTSGKVIFVHAMINKLLTDIVNGNDKSKMQMLMIFHFITATRSKMKSVTMSAMKLSVEKRQDRSENGTISSPKTPLCQPNHSSPSPIQLASPICEESASNTSNSNGTDVGLLNIKEVLEDESAKKLLQVCATSWLYSRVLICGNLVAIPMLSNLCIFRVTSANKLPADGSDQDLMKDRTHGMQPQNSEELGHMKDAFSINRQTKVYLHRRMNSTVEGPQKQGLPLMQSECSDGKTIIGHDRSKLGGLHEEYAVLKDIIVSSMKNTLSSFGLRTTKGVLLYGPPGTGKTSLARLCAVDAGVNLFSINGPEIISQNYGESEQAMHKIFDSACQSAPAVVFIDELDAIAPARKDGGEELSQRMVATLLNLMDGIGRTDGLLIIAATNRPDSIEPALRRPGRLDREIEIGVPSPGQRLDILHTLLSEMKHSVSDTQLKQLAMATHGFVGADLAALCNEAALVCLKRYVRSKKSDYSSHPKGSSAAYEDHSDSMVKGSDCSTGARDMLRDSADSASSSTSHLHVSLENLSSSCLDGDVSEITDNIENGIFACSKEDFFMEEALLNIVSEDFEMARMKVRPSAMREVILEVPKVNWEDVGGQREIKTQLMEAVLWPQTHQDAFKRIGTRPPTGILMFGPPGCSKTLMARAVASKAGLNFLAVKGPELFSKWVGESEKAVRSLFAKARANAPSIIFFDEIDGLAVIRGKESDGVSVSDRVMSQLLIELDGLQQRVNVTVIAATNRPDKIDPALLRPGRFDRLLYVGPPNQNDREDIFRIHLRKVPCSSDVNVKKLACLTDGCTGADIALICREAAVAAIEENIDASEVSMQHLKMAIQQVQPMEINSYQDLSAKFQRLVRSSDKDELGNQECVNRSNSFSVRTVIKSVAHILNRSSASGSGE
ncbi:calmodulin-interacting protein [Salix suchowensis]|nr:calmodulin-interacting protein [Salix suchowensis]